MTSTIPGESQEDARVGEGSQARLSRSDESLSGFDTWTGGRAVHHLGTGNGLSPLPIQSWRHFKEAFAPEVVRDAFAASSHPVQAVLDPFGGSGTTGVAAQFLGATPTLAEVNPFLADVITAKLQRYDPRSIVPTLERLLANLPDVPPDVSQALPATFLAPGRHDRYLFHAAIGRHILQIRQGLSLLEDAELAILLRVLVSSLIVWASNARVSGKGRRYRAGWKAREITVDQFDEALRALASRVADDVRAFGQRKEMRYRVLKGDSRAIEFGDVEQHDLAVTSPPYPNSFDYTDIYNIELWMLGYLGDFDDNRRLREGTLDSHLQIVRSQRRTPGRSPQLERVIDALASKRETLWSPHIPEMVEGYFGDLVAVGRQVASGLRPGSQLWMVVGDSQYAGVHIQVPQILMETLPGVGFEHVSTQVIREMRSAPQQGGVEQLPESIVVFRRL